jgi:hypothetical protein
MRRRRGGCSQPRIDPMRTLLIPPALTLLGLLGPLGGPPAPIDHVQAPPAPAGQPLSDAYDVRARAPGGRWRSLSVYLVRVDLQRPSQAAMVELDSDGPVQIQVTRRSGRMHSIRLRPSSSGVKPILGADGRTATFTLPRPLDVSFEADGDTQHNLHVFVNPLERGTPRRGDPGVIYFGPGTHDIPGSHVLEVPSDTTVEIAGGAVVRGMLSIKGSHVTIRGHGIIDPSAFFDTSDAPGTITLEGASDVGIRDVTILDAPTGGILVQNSRRVVVSRVREINSRRFSDGIDVTASQNVLIENVFLRTSDDSVAVYGSTPWGAHGSTSAVTVRNSTLWPDIAHPILVGTHGNPDGHDTIRHLLFDDLDILQQDEPNPLYQGAMAVDAGDRISAADIAFEDVRVDEISHGQLVNVRVFRNGDYNKQPGRAVRSVFFRDITYPGSGDLPSQIEGYDDSRTVSGITFENLRRNGKLVLDAATGNIDVGAHASNIVFRARQRARVHDDGSPAIRYTGPWERERASGFFGGGAHACTAGSAAAAISFNGRQARVFGAVSPAGGIAAIQLDGGPRLRVDTYSSVTRKRQLWLDTGVLSAGKHVLRIRCTGSRDQLSSGRRVALDRLEIVP